MHSFVAGKRGGAPDDKENFVALIRDLRIAFDISGKNYLLTAAIGAAKETIDLAYDVPGIYKYLDFVHVMCYDYHGKWDKKTGHNAPLYSRPKEKERDLTLNVNATWAFLSELGAIPSKTVLGVPFYGRAFHLKNPHDARMGARARDTSFAGPFTREDGFLGYNEICEEQRQHEDTDKAWKVEWSDGHAAPYMHKDLKWISFDDRLSIALKTYYAASNGLGGVMAWSIDTDDFRGKCGRGKYPLLKTVNRVLSLSERGQADVFDDRASTGASGNLGPGKGGSSPADSPSPAAPTYAIFAAIAVVISIF